MKILEKLNKNINSISPYSPGKPIEDVARELGLDPEDIIKLASNECAFGTSPKAAAAMHTAIENCFRYPDGAVYKLRKKIAKKFDVDMEEVIVSNGSNEILELIGHCFMNQHTTTVFSCHTFVVYKLVTQLFGAKAVEVPMTNSLVHDIKSMVRQIDQRTSVLFICNPNNPTGTMVDEGELLLAIESVPEDVLVVIDEAYAEVALVKMPDTLPLLKNKKNILICRTFSKGYGLAGLRLGYGIGPKPLIQALQKARQPFNVNIMAQEAGLAALDDEEFVEMGRNHYRNSKEYMENVCRELMLEFIETTTNFMLIKVGDGAQISKRLMEKGIIVRSMEVYQLPNYIRVTFGKEKENIRFAETLRTVL